MLNWTVGVYKALLVYMYSTMLPQFSRDSFIWKGYYLQVLSNVSELKKNDFENLLQVSSDTYCRPIDSKLVHSALYQSLTDSSQNLTMTS